MPPARGVNILTSGLKPAASGGSVEAKERGAEKDSGRTEAKEKKAKEKVRHATNGSRMRTRYVHEEALTLYELMFTREKNARVDAVRPCESQRRHDAMTAAEHAPVVQVGVLRLLDRQRIAVVGISTGEEIGHLIDDE